MRNFLFKQPVPKLFPILGVLIISFFLYGCGGNSGAAPGGKTASTPLAVEGYVVRTSVISGLITASGTVVAENETVLYPETSGRIVQLSIPEGKSVSKGTLLMKIYDADLQAQLNKVNAQIALAKETEQRLSQLLKVNGVARQEYDQAVLQLNVLNADAELLRVQIGKTELRAPFDGIVGLRQLSEGAFASAQTPVCTIRSASNLKLDFSVPEKYGPQIYTGMPLTFKLEGDTATYRASVIATEQSVELNTRNLNVRAVVNGNERKVLPGAFAEVNVILGSKSDAIMIPSQSIIPQARNKVVIVSRGGKAMFVPVKTGIREESAVEILSGLQVGDTIATTGVLFIRPEVPISFSTIN